AAYSVGLRGGVDDVYLGTPWNPGSSHRSSPPSSKTSTPVQTNISRPFLRHVSETPRVTGGWSAAAIRGFAGTEAALGNSHQPMTRFIPVRARRVLSFQ